MKTSPLMSKRDDMWRAEASCKEMPVWQMNDLFLLYFCRKGDVLAVKTLLKNGCNVSILTSEDKEALLHCACREGDVFVVQILLKNGCSIGILAREKKEVLLHCACREPEGNVFVVHALLKNGCNVSILSSEEKAALLHCACHEGDVFVVQTLLKNGCSLSILSSEEKEALLHCADHEGDVLVVKAFLKNGCNVNIVSRETKRALLRCACHEGDLFVVQALLRYGFSISILLSEEKEALLRCACREGDVFVIQAVLSILPSEEKEALLHCACHEGNVFVVQALLKNGCSVRILSSKEKEALLRCACNEGDLFVVGTLIENGCRVSILSSKEKGALLLCACHEGDVFVVQAIVNSQSSEEKEALLHFACRQAYVFVVLILLKKGCSIGILSTEKKEGLLHCACREPEGNVFLVHALLKHDCSVSILSSEEKEALLRCACNEGDLFVVRTLLKNGCRVSILSSKEKGALLLCACHEGDVFVVQAIVNSQSSEEKEALLHFACRQAYVFVVQILLKNGCSIGILAREKKEALLRCACRAGDVFVVQTIVNSQSSEEKEALLHFACRKAYVFVVQILLKNGCSIGILAREKKEVLLHCACREPEGNVFVVHALLKNGCNVSILSSEEKEALLHCTCHEGDLFVVQALLNNGSSVSILSSKEKKKLLIHACYLGHIYIVEALIAAGCNVNCAHTDGCTPLMGAAREGHEEVVRALILAGADLNMQSTNGSTALHFAAISNHTQCGILLAEGGASVRAKNTLNETPFDIASEQFTKAIKQSYSFASRKTLCIIGNAEGGKSTLIAALQAERNSFLGRIFNQLRRVQDPRKRTAGIETVLHRSQRYGEVLFFDFAGQDDYHGPHQMFLESLLTKPGVSMTILLVVKMTEEDESIMHQLHRWLSPMALMSTTASPPQIIVVGSFLDRVASKKEAAAKLSRCIQATRNDLMEELPLEFVGSCFLNCRKPQSDGIDKLCHFLQEIPIPEFRAIHTTYSLAWVLYQIRSSSLSQAVQLQEFEEWIQRNKDSLPRTMPPPEEVCQDLSAAGHALYLPNKVDPPNSWLVLDLPSILQTVYGTLFSHSKEIVNVFGLLHRRQLAKLFPDLDLEMVQQLLISLEFCIPVDPSVLKVDLSKLTQSEDASGWLFFPALISAKPPPLIPEGLSQRSVHYLCWQLRTSKKHSISARVLQTILLCLAAHFVVKHHLSEGVQHCCSVWWNGITWQSKKGIDITVHTTNNRVIQVVGGSNMDTSDDKSFQYFTDVISDILAVIWRLSPKLAADSYIVHPPRLVLCKDVSTPPPTELFPVADIQDSVRRCEPYCLSLKDSNNFPTRVVISDLFGGYTPSVDCIERIIWARGEPNQPQSPAVPNQPQSPAVPNQPQSPAVPNQPQSPAVPSQPQSPTVPNQPQSPAVPNQPQSPAVPNQPQSPAVSNQPQSPAVPSQPQSPTVPNQPQSPAVPNQPQSPTVPSQPQSPAVSNQPHSPAVPNQPQSLTVPNQPQSPAVPNQPQSPAVSNQPQSPAVPNQPQSPAVPNQPQSPAVPNQPQSPAVPNQHQSPAVPNQPQSPTVPNQPQAPTVPNQPDVLVQILSQMVYGEFICDNAVCFSWHAYLWCICFTSIALPVSIHALMEGKDTNTLTLYPSSSAECEGYLVLFRTYVSRKSAEKGRAVLEKLEFDAATIRACYGRHPLNEEEAVQDGLIKWSEGQHPTWKVLLNAMEYAGIEQTHCQGLREELYQKLKSKCVCCTCMHIPWQPLSTAVCQ